MKANKLRVGNIVYEPLNENKKAFKVFEIYHEDDYDKINYYNALNFEPVPLTKEWLLQFGFVYRGIYYHFPKYDIFKLEQYKNKNAFWLRHGSESIDCTRINFVHQLQNLYFAITGSELQLTAP